MRTRATALVGDASLGYDQKLRRLAALATEVIAYPAVSAKCQEALDKRVICDMYEGNAPYTPRYVLPDYQLAIANGSSHLELDPPTNLDDALAFLQIMYAHIPSVTTYPVYLGDLDKELAPFVDGVSDERLDRSLRRFWISLDRMLPDAFVHTDIGPADSRLARSILRVERSLRQVVPNITLKVEGLVSQSGVREGLCLVNAMHITASVFINDDESGLHHDYEVWLEKLAPHAPTSAYRHNRTGEDNADAHLKRQIMGREVVVAITKGKLDLGPWEQIFYGEFDGRRRKRALVKIIGD